MRTSPVRLVWLFAACLLLLPGCGKSDDGGSSDSGKMDTPPPYAAGGVSDDLASRIEKAMAKGRAYLLTQQQENGGIGFPGDGLPGMTSLAVAGLVAATPKDEVRDDEAIAKAFDYLMTMQSEKGSIEEKTGKTNYITSAVVGALAFARNPRYTKNLVLARDYVEHSQIGGDENDLSYGGFPYKQDQGVPADLSNGQFAFDALKTAEAAGQKADPKVWERARVYLSRVQNRSETNTGSVKVKLESGEEVEVVSDNDGGGIYNPGSSKVGPPTQRADGKWVVKSYGSMTYALLKCLLFAGVEPSDPRVEAAVGWIQRNWTVEKNPGFDTDEEAYSGHFYYLYTASRALAEYEGYSGKPLVIKDANGQEHDWRTEIAEKILAMQQADGSWSNQKSARWDEQIPALATGYLLQALAFVTGRLP